MGLGLGGAWEQMDFDGVGSATALGGLAEAQFRCSVPLSRRYAPGLELGYRQTFLGSPASGGVVAAGQSVAGTFNFSGPYVRLVLALGPQPFTR